MTPERLPAPVRDPLEMLFYLELHGCPNCGCRDPGNPRTNSGRYEWDVDGTPGATEWRSSIRFDLTCPQCGHERAYLFWETPDFKLPYRDDHLSGAETPSFIISPHEFVAELLRADRELPANLIELTGDARPDTSLLHRAIECCNELLKFFSDRADELSVSHFRTPEALATRAAHPEHFTRAFVLAYLAKYTTLRKIVWAQCEAEHAAREAAGIVRAPVRIPLVGLSDAALKAHAQWLADKDGQRLEVRDVDAPGRRLSALDLTAAILERCTLDRADLSFAKLHAAKLTDVSLREASLSSAMVAGTTLTRCDFTSATMVITQLGDAEISGCDFSKANLDRSTWYRSTVTGCTFLGARMTDAGIDKAVFTDCDFRGADFSHGRVDTGTSMDVVFLRCDLRDTTWLDRDLFRARFIECKLAGIAGRPNITEWNFESPDLSPAGDGSQIATWREVLTLWGIDPDHPRRTLTWHKCHGFTLAEYELVKPQLAGMGVRIRNEAVNRDKVWVDVYEPIDDPIAPKLDALLAAHRASIPKPPLTERETRHAALAQEIIDESLDRGLSFEDTIGALLQRGFSREEAMTAMTRPVASR